jgi:hypothetical protein
MMKELFGITHVRDNEEEDPNVKHMHVGEEEVSLSQLVTTTVPPEEEEVPVSQGLQRLPPEEEDVPVPLDHPLSRSHKRKKSRSPPPPLSRSSRRKRMSQSCGSPLVWSHRKEGDTLSPLMTSLARCYFDLTHLSATQRSM